MYPASRTRLTLIATLILAVLSVLLAPSSAPMANAAAGPPTGFGWARFGHFAPEEDAVDVFVDGTMFVEGIEFKNVSDYLPLPSGPHRFEVRVAGGATGEPILSVEAGVPDGASVTIGAVSTRDGVAAQVYTDDLVQPPADAALVRFIHAAPDVAAVDVTVVGGADLATNVLYPTATEYNPITPGTYDVEVRSVATDDVVLRVNGWSIEPGVQSSIVIVRGSDGAIDVAPVTDAVAVAMTPVGGIQTGGGAMSDILDPPRRGNLLPVPSSLVIVAAAMILVIGVPVARRTRWFP